MAEIVKVRKSGIQKICTVPQKSEIQIGDYVILQKVEESKGKDENNDKHTETV